MISEDKAIANLVGVNKETIRRWKKEGVLQEKIEMYKIKRKMVFPKGDAAGLFTKIQSRDKEIALRFVKRFLSGDEQFLRENVRLQMFMRSYIEKWRKRIPLIYRAGKENMFLNSLILLYENMKLNEEPIKFQKEFLETVIKACNGEEILFENIGGYYWEKKMPTVLKGVLEKIWNCGRVVV